MSWTQLGLFLEASLPTRLNPKRKFRKTRFKPAAKKVESSSKPIRKKRDEKYVVLAPGELDDDIDF